MAAAGTVAWARPEPEWGTSSQRGLMPRADPAWVRRPDLQEVLNLASHRPLTTVVAGPGYGKTSLLASWAGTVPCAWYSLCPADSALPVLVRGLVEALRVRLPELPDTVAAWLGTSARWELDYHIRVDVLAGALADAVERLGGTELGLVIDDVHNLPPQGASVRLLEALCRQTAPVFHLVLSSRVPLPFPVQYLRGRGQVLELDSAMLAFTVAQTETLLVGVVGDGGRLSGGMRPLAERVHELTGGWPAATRLAAEWLRHRPPAEVDTLLRAGGPLFDYVAECVRDSCDATLRALLAEVAALPRFTVELCQVLGVDVDETAMARLARDGMFLRSHPGREGWFALVPLIRGVAAARMQPDHRREVLSRATSWCTDHGHLADALSCVVEQGELDGTAQFLADHGEGLLAQGGVTELLAATSGLPTRLRDAAIEQLEGHALLVHGDWRGAVRCLHRASGEGWPLAPVLAWRLCWSHYLGGEFDQAVALVDRTLLGEQPTSDGALLLAWAACASWRRGDLDRARSLAARAIAGASASGDDQALAVAHTAMLMVSEGLGDRPGAEAHATMGLAAAQRAGDVLQIIPILVHRARNHIEQGACREALPELETAIGYAEHVGYPAGLAFALVTRGRARLGLGRLDEAIADFDASRTAYQRIESGDIAFPLLGMADAYRERGDVALARLAYSEAVAWAERQGDTHVLVPALAGLARVLIGEDPWRADVLAARALEHAHGSGRVIALLAAGWVALERGAPEQAHRWAVEAADIASTQLDRAGLAEAVELRVVAGPDCAAQLSSLREMASIWADIGNPVAVARNALAQARLAGASESEVAEAEQHLRGLGVREPSTPVAGLLGAVPAPVRTRMRIRTLGGFGILRDGSPVRAAEWNSKKARDLLKLLISRRGRPTPRELLIELLWPAEDPARCANRLSVALSAIRTVLDPEHRYPPDHFVCSDKHAVRLANLHIDVEEFLAAAARLTGRSPGSEVLDELRATEARYTGDFLEEDPYEDWAVSMREQAGAAYLAVARSLAAAAGAAADYDLAVRSYLRVLERDPYDEEAHLSLIAVLTAAGRHGQARARYRSYTHRMAELGIEASPLPAPARRSQHDR